MKKLIGTVLSLTILGLMAIPVAAQGRQRNNTSQELTRREFRHQNPYNNRNPRDEFRNNRRQRWDSHDNRWKNNDHFWWGGFGRNNHDRNRRY